MPVDVEAFRANFPGRNVPALLLRVLEHQNASNDFYSGRFELVVDTADACFDGDAEAASRFVVFGQAGTGSEYAFWFHGPERDVARAPIAYLASEGEGSCVLAGTFEDFLKLLAVGWDEPGCELAEPMPSPALRAFRGWLKKECGIALGSSQKKIEVEAEAIIREAQEGHPDLGEWIEAWQARHFGVPSGPAAPGAIASPWLPEPGWSKDLDLVRILGKPRESEAFAEHVSSLAASLKSSDPDVAVMARRVQRKGAIEYSFTKKKLLGTIFVFDKYPGQLPAGIRFGDSKESIFAKLGPPGPLYPDRRYDYPSFALHLEFSTAGLKTLTFMTADEAPGRD